MSLIDSIAYLTLKKLTTDKYKKTNEEIATEHVIFDAYDPGKWSSLLTIIKEKGYCFSGKRLLDIGCGTGDLAITLGKSGAGEVVGVDVDSDRIESARRMARKEGVDKIVKFECVDFVDRFEPSDGFDFIFSTAAFEHIPDPMSCFRKIHSCLHEKGFFFTVFGPLWLSPYGAHMQEFCKVPWVHLLFPEKVVLQVRHDVYRPDEDVERYEDIRGHLNRITVKKTINFAVQSGFDIKEFRINPGADRKKNLYYRYLNKIINQSSTLRELCSFQLLLILAKNTSNLSS
jgi:cyclopropane fatty-acyl-phospholipid synthase-like methyltransferase